jgi:hypothetical protein
MEVEQEDDMFSFSKLNKIRMSRSTKSTRPMKVSQEHKFNIQMKQVPSAASTKEIKPVRTCREKIIIRQGNKYKAVFDIWIGVLVAYSCVTAAYFATFQDPPNSQEIADLCLESFFWIDMFLNFFSEYTDPKTHEVISDLKKIAIHYIFKSTFILDFLAVFPFYTIFGGSAILTKLFRLVRLPRLVRLLDNYKFIKLVTTASIITYFFG